jgi:hypothetical protein
MIFSDTSSEKIHFFRRGVRKIHLVWTWCRNFPLRAFSDTRTEIISHRAWMLMHGRFLSRMYRNTEFKICLNCKKIWRAFWDMGTSTNDVAVKIDFFNTPICDVFCLATSQKFNSASQIDPLPLKPWHNLWMTSIQIPIVRIFHKLRRNNFDKFASITMGKKIGFRPNFFSSKNGKCSLFLARGGN